MRPHTRPFRQILLCGIAFILATGGSLPAQEASQFLRFVETGPLTGRVDTAVATYQTADGVEIALIAAIHIADKAYYETLNERFRAYDAVLYEMVKIKKPRRPAKPASPTEEQSRPKPPRFAGQMLAAQMQKAMQFMLKLEWQLDAVDYTRPNFVHADMDAETFARLQSQKGENFLTLMLQSALQERQRQLSGQTRPLPLADVLRLLSSQDSAHSLKWLFAQQLDQIELMLSGIDRGIDGKGSVIITERNKVAMNALDRQLRRRQQKLAIFYGAGHMLDLEKRLLARGCRKIQHEWITAWNLRPTKSSAESK